MSDYRDELAAAQARIARLEDEIAARDRPEAKPDGLAALENRAKTNAKQQAERWAEGAGMVALAQRRATSRLGFAHGGVWWAVIALPAVVGLMMVLDFGGKQPGSADHIIGASCLAVAFVAALMTVGARIAVRASVARDLAWADALPFALVDHFKMFGPRNGLFKVHFAGAPPDAASFEKWVAGVPLPAWASLRTRSEFDVEIRTHGAVGGRAHWRFFRTITSTLLVPLHERFPIEKVTCRD